MLSISSKLSPIYIFLISNKSLLNNVASSSNLLLLQNWTFTLNLKRESLKLMKTQKVLCSESFHVEQQTDNVTQQWGSGIKSLKS